LHPEHPSDPAIFPRSQKEAREEMNEKKTDSPNLESSDVIRSPTRFDPCRPRRGAAFACAARGHALAGVGIETDDPLRSSPFGRRFARAVVRAHRGGRRTPVVRGRLTRVDRGAWCDSGQSPLDEQHVQPKS
jgi:hypothetical protein